MKFRVLLAAGAAAGVSLWGQTPQPACRGPEELTRAAKAKPSAGVYDALGAYFAEKGQMGCALASFRTAVKLEPGSNEAHYNLGVALLQTGDAAGAVQQLQPVAR